MSLWIGQTRLPLGGFTKIVGGLSVSPSSVPFKSFPLLPIPFVVIPIDVDIVIDIVGLMGSELLPALELVGSLRSLLERGTICIFFPSIIDVKGLLVSVIETL